MVTAVSTWEAIVLIRNKIKSVLYKSYFPVRFIVRAI